MTNAVSGMAASIRAATDSETFDLAGHDARNISATTNDAFSQPFPLDQMIRLTFVTGAGKLSRQKYDDKAMQTLTSALRQLDYVEDRGASCVNECGGSYKTQHDTGKNLFTVVVFPRLVERGEDPAGDDAGAGASEQYPMAFPLTEGTPEYIVLMASEEIFQKNAPSMSPSWSEKKSCSEVLKAALETVEKLDAKLMSGTPLADDENEFYDAVGGATSVATKAECLKRLMQQQAEGGSLTRHEIDRLLAQVNDRIDGLNEEIDAATRNSQEKKAARLAAQKAKAEARKRMLEGRAAAPPHRLRHEAQILALKKRLKPLLKVEQSAKGRLLSAKEAKELAVADEVRDEIAELEEASQGWFEDDDAFAARLDASRKRLDAAVGSANKGASGKGKKPGTRSRSSAKTNWLTPGGVAAKQAALGKRATKKKAGARSNGGSAFSAMMMDSDSD